MDPRWLEAASGSAALLFGAAIFSREQWVMYPAYAPLHGFISDDLLAAVFVVSGLVQLATVLLDHPLARIPIAAEMASAWLLISYSSWIGAPGSPTTPILMVLAGWNAAAMVALIHLALRRRP